MKKTLVIILFMLVGRLLSVSAAGDVEQMATTLGSDGQPTVGTNLLLNIKPKANTNVTYPQEPTSTDAGSPISIIGGQVKKNGTGSSASGVAVSGAGISKFNSGRSSSVSSVSATSATSGVGGPRKVGPGNIGDPGAAEDTPVGAAPFALILLLSIGYGLYKKLIFNDEKPSS